MKVTKDDYTIMAKAIATYMPVDATERQRWDALWQATDQGRLDYATLSGYQDSHVDTALRRISKEYGTSQPSYEAYADSLKGMDWSNRI